MREPADLDQLQGQVDVPERAARWLAGLEPAAIDGPTLPDDEDADRLLDRLDVPAEARAEVLAARPDPQAHKAYWWIFDRIYRATAPTVGQHIGAEGFGGWPALTTSAADAMGRHLYLWAYLALLPRVRRHHLERGIPDDVAWETLSLAVHLQLHREITGHHGLGLTHQWGPPIRLRGAYYRLGRLDFHRAALSFGNGPGGFALAVHIPPTGPLDPTAVEESIARARDFFARHYSDEPNTFFTCHSWLLDPQLAEYLPPESNILAFQRRFTLTPPVPGREPASGDRAILRFVFNDHGETDLDTLPQNTKLERAYVAHRRSGRHWDERTGWLEFEDTR